MGRKVLWSIDDAADIRKNVVATLPTLAHAETHQGLADHIGLAPTMPAGVPPKPGRECLGKPNCNRLHAGIARNFGALAAIDDNPPVDNSIGSKKMPNRVQDLVDQALTLTDDERAELVGRLMETLAPISDFDPDYEKEIDRRIREIDAGRAKMLSLDETIARMRGAMR